jgi:hypothetical protein
MAGLAVRIHGVIIAWCAGRSIFCLSDIYLPLYDRTSNVVLASPTELRILLQLETSSDGYPTVHVFRRALSFLLTWGSCVDGVDVRDGDRFGHQATPSRLSRGKSDRGPEQESEDELECERRIAVRETGVRVTSHEYASGVPNHGYIVARRGWLAASQRFAKFSVVGAGGVAVRYNAARFARGAGLHYSVATHWLFVR